MTEAKPRLMVVDDDVRLTELIADFFRYEGFEVSVENHGGAAAARILDEQPDVVILDLMLPGEDGLAICRKVRPEFTGVILMLTARQGEIDQVVGLELGADDYVPKPASPRLLLARVRAQLRRVSAAPKPDDTLATQRIDGDLVADQSAREARIGEQVIDLTTAEFDLLWTLMGAKGTPVTREDLLRELRGISYNGLDRSIDVRVSQLRRKLSASPDWPDRIKTVRGVGYQFVPTRT